MNFTGSHKSRYFFIMSMSSFLAVSLNSLMIVIILSSIDCIALFISFISSCSDFISFMAFLWLLSMFCSTTSDFLRSSLYLSSPTRILAAIRFICSVIALSGAAGGVFCEKKPCFAGSGIGCCSSGIVFPLLCWLLC